MFPFRAFCFYQFSDAFSVLNICMLPLHAFFSTNLSAEFTGLNLCMFPFRAFCFYQSFSCLLSFKYMHVSLPCFLFLPIFQLPSQFQIYTCSPSVLSMSTNLSAAFSVSNIRMLPFHAFCFYQSFSCLLSFKACSLSVLSVFTNLSASFSVSNIRMFPFRAFCFHQFFQLPSHFHIYADNFEAHCLSMTKILQFKIGMKPIN